MAGSKKNSGAKAKSENKKAASSRQKVNSGNGTSNAASENPVNQFWSIILFALGVLIFLLTVIEGSSGWKMIHQVLRGLFGVSVFIVPVILIYTAVLIGMERSQRTVYGKAMWGTGLILLSSSVVQVIFEGLPQGDSFAQKCKYLYETGSDLEGGGMLSALVAWPLMKFFGVIGARIIVCVLLFIFIMLLSNLTLFQLFKFFTRPFKKMYHTMQDIREENQTLEAYEEWEYDEEQEALRLANSQPESSDVVPDPDYDINMNVPDDGNDISPPDFGQPNWSTDDSLAIDVPINTGPPVKEPLRAPESKNVEKEPKENNKSTGLDDIINQAISGENKEVMPESFAEKAAKVEENSVKVQITENTEKQYMLPSIKFLNKGVSKANDPSAGAELKQKADMLIETLKSFGVNASIIGIQRGPRVTRYEIKPAAGVKVAKITNLSNDIALNLAAKGVRIEAPIPGKAAIGIEIPNTNEDIVSIREIIESREFKNAKSKIAFAVGKDIAGNVIIGDVAKMPHMIIAGTTGSGKSVCTNSIIMSILYRATPEEVKLILIDPKMVEFTTYNGIPHLLIPVVTEPRQAAGALNWGVQEMLRRYKLFSDNSVKDISGYNEMADSKGLPRLSQIVIAIDEFADLMMAASKEVEDSVCRLAQMARAAGMHLIIATQRPTTDVITGLIKANIPSRIALKVQGEINSRTILDSPGAEKLLGLGDMLYFPNGMQKPLRVQGCFCSTKEIESVVEFIKQESETSYNEDIIEAVEQSMPTDKSSAEAVEPSGNGDDVLIERAIDIAVEMGQVSTTALQRKLKLGFARAARIVDELEEMGVIGPSEGAKPRKVLMSKQQWAQRRMSKNTEN